MIDLEPLARQLGVAVEHLWGVLLRQAPISGAFDLLFYAFTAAAAYGTYRLWLLMHHKVEEDKWDEIGYIWPSLASVAVFIMAITALCSLSTTAAAFFNPEYWALREVLSAFKK